MNTEPIHTLRGIVVPMVTPLTDIDELDIPGTEKLIEHILAGGVSGIFVLGTTGEFSSLSYRLRNEFIERVCNQVKSRVPVLVGITDTAMVESVNLARKAADCGASAVVSAPPYYFSAGQPELIEYYRKMIRKLPLPVYLYNMPVHTKIMLEPATVKTIAEDGKVIGLKDSSANAFYFRMLHYTMKEKPGFGLFVGPEEITADAVLMGARGGVNGGANMFPGLYMDLYNAAVSRDFARIQQLQEKVLQISSTIYTVGKFGSSYLKGLKCALSIMGLCSDYLAEPFHRFRKEEHDKIQTSLEALDLPFSIRLR